MKVKETKNIFCIKIEYEQGSKVLFFKFLLCICMCMSLYSGCEPLIKMVIILLGRVVNLVPFYIFGKIPSIVLFLALN